MKKTFFFLLTLFCFSNVSKAQTSLQVSDPYVYLTDTVGSVTIKLGTYLNNVSGTQEVIFMLGTSADSSTIILVNAALLKQAGNTFLQYNGEKFLVRGNEVYIKTILTKQQYNVAQYLTVYAKDLAGAYTTHVNINIKQH